ncbi:MAG: MloB [Deltaproteobacteria bacterium]|nr:MloB [Deltaproteobacteria bacterium]
MTVTLAQLEKWLRAPSEDEHLEFKEAKNDYDFEKLVGYCVALANEGGGHMVLGVSDKQPRKVVGTRAFDVTARTVAGIYDRLHLRVETTELTHPDGRVLVFSVPSRPAGQPIEYKGRYFMRAGEELVPMTPEHLKKIFAEGQPGFLNQIAIDKLSADEVVARLDIQTFFDLLKLPLPSDRDGILARLISEDLVRRNGAQLSITNLGAVLLAKDLRQFDTLRRKTPRVIVYKGKNKLDTIRDQIGGKGYAVGFEGLIAYINSQLPANEVIGKALRDETQMYPEIAIRELVANALIHQDFDETGSSVLIEIYTDRIEIANPGKPMIPTERFVDEYKSRNERLADLMRRMGICEEKSSGIDKVIFSTEYYQLPAPDFRVGTHHTSIVLFAHKDFAKMEKRERVRACYLHCCLRYVNNEKMTNQSLRERFRLPETKTVTLSQIIAATLEEKLIKLDDSETTSRRYAKYVPFWA